MKNEKERFGCLAAWVALAAFGLAFLERPPFVRARYPHGILSTCSHNLKRIGTAIEMYSVDNNSHYPRNLEMLVPKYLKALPQCPNGENSYRAEFGPKAPLNPVGFADYYCLECTGNNHSDRDSDPDFPKFDAVIGVYQR